ncbi:hypothetical protein [Brachybacterium tyrofermentans]|uniref:Uncharacterized protein n=1 Tax=Brachybacterium tyrofermentans TaxID=47848 RepID=A0ABW0FIR3_9MICO
MVQYILDPEIIVPTESAKMDQEFWLRLSTWSKERQVRIGVESLEFLCELYENPPPSAVIGPRDISGIVGRLVGRVLEGELSAEKWCACEWIYDYSPILGDADNPRRLLQDVASQGAGVRTVVATDARCWSVKPNFFCSACGIRHTYIYGEGLGGPGPALRDEFLGDRNNGIGELERRSRTLFPEIVFSDSAWSRVSKVIGDSQEILRDVTHHLGVLNDFAVNIWRAHSEPSRRIGELASRGADASPESVKTKSSEKYMKYRDFDFGNTRRRCEWHTKFRPNGGRIHFLVEGEKVYVGTIEEHLPTPD